MKGIVYALTIAVFVFLTGSIAVAHSEVTLNAIPTRHVPKVIMERQASPVGVAAVTKKMHLDLILQLRNQAKLAELLKELYNPASPEYHHFLTEAQFTQEFAPTQEDYDKVTSWAQSNGFSIGSEPINRLVVPLTGTVEEVNSTFHLTMRRYQKASTGRIFYAPDREPSVDQSLPLWHVSGLSNYSVPRPLVKLAPNGLMANASGSGPGGSYLAQDMRAAYYGSTTLTGKGQCVGLAEFDGYDLSDLTGTLDGAATATTNGDDYTLSYSPSDGEGPFSILVHNELINGGTLTPVAGDVDAEGEVVLDIAQVVGMAPGVNQINVYIAPDPFTSSGEDADSLNTSASEIFDQMVQDDCKQLSISWTWNPESIAANDPIFENMMADGQSFFAASGDFGSWPNDHSYYPEEDAYVTSVGGTNLTTNGARGSWESETAWSDSGGGVSPDDVPLPPYQKNSGFTCSGCSTSYRNAPDVAMEAAGDNYVCAFGNCEDTWEGTSFAAPRWAAFLALVNQDAAANGNSGGLGLINYQLYAEGLSSTYTSDFHDITSGSNGSYSAGTGYDLVTGWGSPNSVNMVDYLANAASCTATPECFGSGNFAEAYVSLSCTKATQVSTSATLCDLYGNGGCGTNNGPSGNLSSSSATYQGEAYPGASCSLSWCWSGFCQQKQLTP